MRIVLGMCLFAIANGAIANSSSYYFASVKYGNIQDFKNNTSDHLITPSIGLVSEHWSSHIYEDFYTNIDDPENKVEVQISYAPTGYLGGDDENESAGIRLYNEIYYGIDSKNWAGEYTTAWFRPGGKNLLYGVEVEVDYLNRNEWGIHEVEIEPTLLREFYFERGEAKLELEAPIFRIYTRDDKKQDFAYEGVQVNYSFRMPLGEDKNTHLKFSMEAPYEEEKDKFRLKVFLGIRAKF